MIVQEHVLKKLRSAFDLNIYEVKVWTALLSKGIATAGELSDISNVPRSRSYDVLESLEKKGFVLMKVGKPIKYLAIKPEEIIKRIKDRIKIQTNSRLQALENVKEEAVFKDLEILYKQSIEHIDPTTLSGAINGRENVYAQLDSMLSNAKESVTIVTTAEGFLRKISYFRSKFKKLAERGVKIKIATQLNEEIKKIAKDLNKIIQVRPLKRMRARFTIIDGKEVLFMITDDNKIHESTDTAIWVNTPFFANALETMFNVNCVERQ